MLTEYAERLLAGDRGREAVRRKTTVRLPAKDKPRVGGSNKCQQEFAKAFHREMKTPALEEAAERDFRLSNMPEGMSIIGERIVFGLLDAYGGRTRGLPNERGMAILAAIGTPLEPGAVNDLLMLLEWGPPTTETYWRVLCACLGCSLDVYARAIASGKEMAERPSPVDHEEQGMIM